jgi:hypothetical protein
MSRLFMLFIVVFSTFTLIGCGATLHTEATVPRSAAIDFDDGPPAVSEIRRVERRQTFAASAQRSCDTYRARYVHRSVSTRDGMRVYCF